MTVTKDDRELLVNQLSDGEKCLLAMVGDIARRLSIANPGLDDPLQGEGVILIDELELHLHPKWQRGIIPKLTETFPNCQFIVATHSPQIVSDVQPESIFILKSTDSGVIVEHPDHSFGRDSNQILEDLMGVPDGLDLLVLSACKTVVGDHHSDLGVVSLAVRSSGDDARSARHSSF